MFIKLAIFFVLNLLLVPSFNFAMLAPDFKAQVDILRGQLDQVCAASECVSAANLVCTEQLLGQLMGVSYFDLLNLSGLAKRDLIANFATHLCAASTGMASASSGWFGAIAGARASAQALETQGYQSLVLDNIANLEHFLQAILGKTYRELIGEMFERKRDQVIDTLRDLLEPKPVISGDFGTSVGLVPGAGAGAGAGGGAVDDDGWQVYGDYDFMLPADVAPAPKADDPVIDYSGAIRHRNETRTYGKDNFYATIGLDWDSSSLSKPENCVEKYEYPDLNKYNEGLAATVFIVLQNNYQLFREFVPQLIKDNLTDIAPDRINFYVEVSAGAGFYDKGRRYNLIFHGAMADWYAAEMVAAGFNFAANGFAVNLPMGIFDFNGIDSAGGDIAKNGLSAQNVNAHNHLYSPDNAGFIIEAGRRIVTFWSVAKSPEKNHAVVTYHILFDFDLPLNFKDRVLGLSRNGTVDTVGKLLDALNGLSGLLNAGLDHAAWVQAIDFLHRMYGHVL